MPNTDFPEAYGPAFCPLCSERIDNADVTRRTLRGYVHDHHQPGQGCGLGSDGQPCSPAYLCPACIDDLARNGGQL